MPSLASREPPLACGALHYSQNRRPKPSLRPNLSIRDAESTTNTSCRTTKATPTRLGGGFGPLYSLVCRMVWCTLTSCGRLLRFPNGTHKSRRLLGRVDMGMSSDFLYARLSFVEGLARILDFGNTFSGYNDSDTGLETDSIALWTDWAVVGQDIRDAIGAFEEKDVASVR